jgi:hypothetical protein
LFLVLARCALLLLLFCPCVAASGDPHRGGGTSAHQQHWPDVRGVGCFVNICGCLFYFYMCRA